MYYRGLPVFSFLHLYSLPPFWPKNCHPAMLLPESALPAYESEIDHARLIQDGKIASFKLGQESISKSATIVTATSIYRAPYPIPEIRRGAGPAWKRSLHHVSDHNPRLAANGSANSIEPSGKVFGYSLHSRAFIESKSRSVFRGHRRVSIRSSQRRSDRS